MPHLLLGPARSQGVRHAVGLAAVARADGRAVFAVLCALREQVGLHLDVAAADSNGSGTFRRLVAAYESADGGTLRNGVPVDCDFVIVCELRD